MLSRDDVVYAYRYLLGREPESEEAIASHMNSNANRAQLVQTFMGAAEYADVNPWGRRWFITPVFDGERLMWVDLFDRFVAHECIRDNWGPDEVHVVRALLRPGDTFIDAGANIGWFTLLASTIVGPGGAIHAFEPHPIIGDFLARTITLNGLDRQVALHRVGLWSEPGEMTLGWNAVAENPGGSHLLPGVPAGPSAGTTVPLAILDSFDLTRCDLMKADVEGAEYHMMRGGQAFFARCRPVLMSELHGGQLNRVSGASTEAFVTLAEAMDYVCYAQQGQWKGERVVGDDPRWADAVLNVLFMPREKEAEVVSKVFRS